MGRSVEGLRRRRDSDRERQRARRAADPERAREIQRKSYALHGVEWRTRARPQREWYQQYRSEMILAYGGVCDCCGETEPRFLALNHIHGGGAEERRTVSVLSLILRLRREGWPKGDYNLLCHNCNHAEAWGPCPHRLEAVG